MPTPGRRDDREPGRSADQRRQLFELAVTAERRGAHQPERALPRALAVQRPDLHGAERLCLALQLERRQRLELGDLGDRERGHLAGDDAARLGGGLQARRHVHRVAGHRPAVGGRFADDRLAGVDADAQPQRVGLEVERCVQPLDRGDEREAGAHRALGVVVAGARDAEHRHDRVADELLEHAAVPRDGLPRCGEVGVLDHRDVLGVEPLGQRREADEVGEEHRHDAPLDCPLRHGQS